MIQRPFMSKLSAAKRKELPSSSFAIKKDRAYPIHDKSHAQNALARVSRHGTPEEKRTVRAAVRRKFPKMILSDGGVVRGK
jgi:hypothetical protein